MCLKTKTINISKIIQVDFHGVLSVNYKYILKEVRGLLTKEP